MPEVKITPLDMNYLFTVTEYTDNKAGTILLYTPVFFAAHAGGPEAPEHNWPMIDECRKPFYVGKTMLQTNKGPMEIRFEILADCLKEAFANFSLACQAHVNELQSQATRNQLTQGIATGPSGSRLDLSKLKGN